jgi:release factor glutamine methyltransferase
MQPQDPVQFLLYQDCLLRVPDPALVPKRGAFLLARHLPLRAGDRILDLGTGAGLLAVLAARRGHDVVATDIVPACCDCVRLNAVLNGVADRLEVRAGDLYAPVAGDRFDLVATNPPQMPTPPDHGWEDIESRADNGGPDGWAVLGPIIDQAAAHLKPGGRLVFTLFGFLGPERALDRLKRAGLRPEVLARETQPFPRLGRERLAHLRSLDVESVPPAGCPPLCDRLVVCGETV